MLQIQCPHCGSPVEVTISAPRIIPMTTVSIIVLEHGGIVSCSLCGTKMIPAASGIQGVAFHGIEIKEQSKIVVPGTGLIT